MKWKKNERKTRQNVNTHSFWNYLFCPHATTQYDKIGRYLLSCSLPIVNSFSFFGLHFCSHSFLRKNRLILCWHVSKRIMLDIMTVQHHGNLMQENETHRKRSNAIAWMFCFVWNGKCFNSLTCLQCLVFFSQCIINETNEFRCYTKPFWIQLRKCSNWMWVKTKSSPEIPPKLPIISL